MTIKLVVIEFSNTFIFTFRFFSDPLYSGDFFFFNSESLSFPKCPLHIMSKLLNMRHRIY